jgi:hypothetical protein
LLKARRVEVHMRMRWVAVALIASACARENRASTDQQSAASAPYATWIADSLTRIGLNDAPGSSSMAEIWAARGETESFQIAIAGGAAGVNSANVSISDLAGPGGATIPHSNVALFREHYVNVTSSSPDWGGSNRPHGGGWYADGLIPFIDPMTGAPPSAGAALVAAPFNVSAGQNQPIWVDVDVPRTAAPGTYTGSFTVSAREGMASGQITVHVWSFALPQKPSLKSSFLLWSEKTVPAYQELLRNRVMPDSVGASNERALIDGYGLNASATGFWSGADVGNCSMNAAPSVAQFQSAVAGHQTDLFLYDYSADEIGGCSNLVPTIRQWAANMHQAGLNNLITMAPISALLDDGSGSGRSAVDAWVMLPVTYDGASSTVLQQALHKGDALWSYNTLVQDAYSPKWELDFSSIDFRIQPGFINQSLGLTGLLYWRADRYNSDAWNQVNNAGTYSSSNYPGEAQLIYPGAPAGLGGVAPSMRLKWLRDGVDDFDYVQILKGLGHTADALAIANGVGRDWSHWTRDPAAIESARRQLGDLIDQLMGGTPMPDAGTITAPDASAPPSDAGVPPPHDASVPPAPDASVPPSADAGAPGSAGMTVTPDNGSGYSATFQITIGDPAGGVDVLGANVLFARSVDGRSACWIAFDAASSQLSLASDDISTWSGGAPGSATGLANSQCAIDLSATSATRTPQGLLITLPIRFSSSFAGVQNIYLRGWSRGSLFPRDYVLAGSFTVVDPSAPAISPSSGCGWNLSLTTSVPDPSLNITGVDVLINSAVDGRRACWVSYDPRSATLWLASDDTSTWSSAPIGSGVTLSNGQCSISGGSGSTAGGTISLVMPILFYGPFAGQRNVYLASYGASGVLHDYTPMGSWDVGCH